MILLLLACAPPQESARRFEGIAVPSSAENKETSRLEAASRALRKGPPVPYAASGYAEAKYVGRWTEGAHDNDLRSYASIDFGDPHRHLVTGHAAGRLALDVDRDRSPTHPFRSVDETYSNDLTARLYAAYVDFNDVAASPVHGILRRVRLGRQILNDTPATLFLDGISVETEAIPGLADLFVSGFVGVPSHLFESSPRQDVATGIAASVSPVAGGEVRFDYIHVTDRYLSLGQDDDLFGISGHQWIAEGFFVAGHLNILDADARDFAVETTWTDGEADVAVTARYTSLVSDQRRHSIDLDYFTSFLATYFAYDQYEIFAHKGVGDSAFLDGGLQVRELREDSNEGTFNHEFRRYWLSPGLAGWPSDGTRISLTGEYWDSGGDRFGAFGGEVTQQIEERLTGTVGTVFQLYRYDVLSDQERQDVQVYQTRLSYRATDAVEVRASFDFEDGDDEDFVTVTVGIKVDF